MSLTADVNPFSIVTAKLRNLFTKYPEWRTWGLSLLAWAFLLYGLFNMPGEASHAGRSIYCLPGGGASLQAHGANGAAAEGTFAGILKTVFDGLKQWNIMVIAMMFPLLNEPIRHVTFSVRRKDRTRGILGFLLGYVTVWMAVGLLFMLLPLFIDMLVGKQNQLITALIKASGFLLAAALTWQPARLVKMTKCAQTMPIRINAPQLYTDTIMYGLKMGAACFNMCWAPMVALMLAHHNFFLMWEVTLVLLCERYILPHTSRLPGYAWGIIAFALYSIEMWG